MSLFAVVRAGLRLKKPVPAGLGRYVASFVPQPRNEAEYEAADELLRAYCVAHARRLFERRKRG